MHIYVTVDILRLLCMAIIVIAWLFILYTYYSTRGGVEKLNTARGVAECCIEASRPQPECCITLTNLLYFAQANLL